MEIKETDYQPFWKELKIIITITILILEYLE